MSSEGEGLDGEWHAVLRCSRGDETRTYSLCIVPGGVELWRVSESPDAGSVSVRESHFTSADETAQFLEEVRRTLRAGGWVSSA